MSIAVIFIIVGAGIRFLTQGFKYRRRLQMKGMCKTYDSATTIATRLKHKSLLRNRHTTIEDRHARHPAIATGD
ncbi:MAG: hypothetical protein V3T88_03435 [Nitrosomonadaceae bacterium]